MKPRLKFERGRNGRGVRLSVDQWNHDHSYGISYMDAAQALFDLKDFLQASDTGRRCLDDIAAKRRLDNATTD